MNQEGIDGKLQSNSLKEAKLVSLIKNPTNKENYEKTLEMASNNPDTKIINDDKNDSADFSMPLVSLQRKKTRTALDSIKECFGYYDETGDRVIYLDGQIPSPNRVPNIVKNQKYNIFTFIPVVLYNQFKFFFNFFYLMITLSQFIPSLQVGIFLIFIFIQGFFFTYFGPLTFVLIVTMGKEAHDDYKRYQRDREANSALYT